MKPAVATLTELPEAIAKVAPAEGRTPPTVAGAPLQESWLDHPLRDVRKEVLARFERAYLANMLRRKQGRVGEAAAAAGLSPRALYDKMKSYGLKKEDFKKRR